MLECKGFEPKEKLTQIVGMNGELQSYLEVKYRIEWFNQYCAENDIKGVIDESDIKYLEQVKMFVATCKIYMDDKLVATGIGGKMVDGDITSMNMIIQSAATIAKGRALANCGFGTAMCANNESGENHDILPCDAGITINTDNNPLINNSAVTKTNEEKQKISKTESKPQSKAKAEKTVNVPKNLTEAQALILSIGKYKGKSLGEVAAIDKQYIDFMANKCSYPDIVAGCKIILTA